MKPKLVIAVGTLASQQMIGIAQLKDAVGRMHRAKRAGRTFDVVVLPHPSGPHAFPTHEGVHPHVGGDAASYAAQLVSPMPSEPVVGYVIVAPVESLNAKL